MKRYVYFFYFAFLTVILFSYFAIDPSRLVLRNNDLYHFFYPLWIYFKDNVVRFHSIPLWQHLIMGGTPVLADPNLWRFFYPGMFFLLFLPFDKFVLIFFAFHIMFAGIGMFMLAKALMRSSAMSSFIAGLVYMFSLQIVGRIEAGHIETVGALSLVPVFLLSSHYLITSHKRTSVFLVALLGSFIFFLFMPVLIYCLPLIIGLIFVERTNLTKHVFWRLLVSSLIFIIITLPFLLSFIDFIPWSSRITLDQTSGLLWSWKLFISSVIFPFFSLSTLHEERVLYVGMIPSALAFLGFLKLSGWNKIWIMMCFFFIFLYVLGNKTPFLPFLYSLFPILYLLRVPTRSWFIVTIIIALLAAKGYQWMEETKQRNFLLLSVLFILVFELFFTGTGRLLKPTLAVSPTRGEQKLYTSLSKDPGFFRIYCTTLCFSPSAIAKSGKGIAGGYSPTQYQRFVNVIQRAGGYHFDQYSHFIPPYQIFDEKPQPNAELLGILSTRFVASQYKLNDPGFSPVGTFDHILLYENKKAKPRAYWTDGFKEIQLNVTERSSSNFFLSVDGFSSGKIVVSELYDHGWKAFLDGEKIPILAENGIIMRIDVPESKAKKLQIVYRPWHMPWLLFVSFVAQMMIGLYLLNKIVL